jgi:glutamine synthetase
LTDPTGKPSDGDRERRLADLGEAGIDTVTVAIVDPAGVTRVKLIPFTKLSGALRSGIGFSRAISVFCVDDVPAAVQGLEAPVGDLRLIPDLLACSEMATQPGVAWAAADQYDEDANVWPACPRQFLRRMLDDLGDRGLSLKTGYELEWFQGYRSGDDAVAPLPAHRGPGATTDVLPHGRTRSKGRARADRLRSHDHVGRTRPVRRRDQGISPRSPRGPIGPAGSCGGSPSAAPVSARHQRPGCAPTFTRGCDLLGRGGTNELDPTAIVEPAR